MKTLRLFATLRDKVGSKEVTVPFQDGDTVRVLLKALETQHPELTDEILDAEGELTGLVHILVHGRHIHWGDGLDTVIRESDRVVLMPPTAGG